MRMEHRRALPTSFRNRRGDAEKGFLEPTVSQLPLLYRSIEPPHLKTSFVIIGFHSLFS